ncbi:MAG: site-2 protease family protein [Saprospiraceae bacterium]|nr:site-2 protease family protein [Saprospiraceae bacterium]
MIEQALKIGTFAGIPVRIHWTFLLIIAYFVISGLVAGHSWEMIMVEVVFVLTIFGCVVLHEFGHALTARRFNIKTEDIILLPIGGVARLRNMPDKPTQELLVAVMGPMVNLIIALFIFTAITMNSGIEYWNNIVESEGLTMSWDHFFPILMVTNIALLVFNMIPAFPMDGGRVLRALLAMWLGKLNATKWATRIGQFICVLLVIVGIWQNAWTMALIGVFIFLSAGQEYRSVVMESMIKNRTLGMVARKITDYLPEYHTAREAMNLLISSGQSSLPVIDLNGSVIGFVSGQKIVLANKQDPEIKIKDLLIQEYGLMHPAAPLAVVIQYFRNHQPFVIVRNDLGEYTHYVDPDVIDQYMKLS